MIGRKLTMPIIAEYKIVCRAKNGKTRTELIIHGDKVVAKTKYKSQMNDKSYNQLFAITEKLLVKGGA